jgi:chromosome segregation ATPase
MDGQLSISLVEIVILMLGAIILGITIHFFIVSRRSLNKSIDETPGGKVSREFSEWKLRYFNDIERRDKEISQLKMQLAEAEENITIYSIEAEEKGIKNKKLMSEIEVIRNAMSTVDKPDYAEQLRQTQSSLLDHNEKINQLLGKIDFVSVTEAKYQELLKLNEGLSGQVSELKLMLAQKEKEATGILKKERLTSEVTSLLDSAYNEFHVLQEKIHDLESQLIVSKTTKMEYEEIKEGYSKVSRNLEEQKLKYNVLVSENRQLQADLLQMDEKFKEANFQRQQIQKKVTYLEEINRDMQVVSDTQKKLEGQLKRISELESMLNIVSEERDDLANRK